jgi:hypothetical protein
VKYAYTIILNFFLPPKIDVSYWNDLKKDLHSDTFLIAANGPSLNFSDLEKLSKYPSIGSNKIYLGFSDTNWRPSLWTMSDSLLAYKLGIESKKFNNILLCKKEISRMVSNVYKTQSWKSIPISKLNTSSLVSSIDPYLNGFYEGSTITVFNIQIAMWLGAKKIYITGLDHFYNEKIRTKAGSKVMHNHTNHFSDNYRKKNEIVNNAPITALEKSYKLINDFAIKNNIEIINISRESHLNVFLRKNIEDIL